MCYHAFTLANPSSMNFASPKLWHLTVPDSCGKKKVIPRFKIQEKCYESHEERMYVFLFVFYQTNSYKDPLPRSTKRRDLWFSRQLQRLYLLKIMLHVKVCYRKLFISVYQTRKQCFSCALIGYLNLEYPVLLNIKEALSVLMLCTPSNCRWAFSNHTKMVDFDYFCTLSFFCVKLFLA